MLRKISIATAVILSATAISAQKIKNSGLERPKLVVGLVVDQMRWDYLYRYYNKYGNDGFKRLLNTGYSLCSHCYGFGAYLHLYRICSGDSRDCGK